MYNFWEFLKTMDGKEFPYDPRWEEVEFKVA